MPADDLYFVVSMFIVLPLGHLYMVASLRQASEETFTQTRIRFIRELRGSRFAFVAIAGAWLVFLVLLTIVAAMMALLTYATSIVLGALLSVVTQEVVPQSSWVVIFTLSFIALLAVPMIIPSTRRLLFDDFYRPVSRPAEEVAPVPNEEFRNAVWESSRCTAWIVESSWDRILDAVRAHSRVDCMILEACTPQFDAATGVLTLVFPTRIPEGIVETLEERGRLSAVLASEVGLPGIQVRCTRENAQPNVSVT